MSKTIHNLHYEQIGKEVKCVEDELPFEIPDNWMWVRLEELGKTQDTDSFADGPFGTNLKREHYVNKPEVRIIQLSNIGDDGWKDDNIKYTSYEHLKTISRCEVNPGDFVIAKMMPAGRTIMIPKLNTKICLGSDSVKFVPTNYINKQYLLYAMKSNMFIAQVYKETHGITRVRTSLGKLKKYFLPIPPLNEQQRILNKIRELEPLIEKYKQAEEKLFNLNSNIKEQLKKSILQYAIEGKLVPQDPNDEPTSVLLERIHNEKEKLIAKGKIKKDKNESVIYRRDNSYYEKQNYIENCIDDELPFEIPDSWRWTNIETISLLIGGKDNQILTKEIMPIGEIPVVSQSKKLIDGYCNNEDKKIDILPLVMFGDHTRNVKYIDFEFVVGADGTKFHKIILCNAKYIYYWMKHSAGIIRNRGYARHYSLLKECYIQ